MSIGGCDFPSPAVYLRRNLHHSAETQGRYLPGSGRGKAGARRTRRRSGCSCPAAKRTRNVVTKETSFDGKQI